MVMCDRPAGRKKLVLWMLMQQLKVCGEVIAKTEELLPDTRHQRA